MAETEDRIKARPDRQGGRRLRRRRPEQLHGNQSGGQSDQSGFRPGRNAGCLEVSIRFSLTQPGATQNVDGDPLTNLGQYLVGAHPNLADNPVASIFLGLMVPSH